MYCWSVLGIAPTSDVKKIKRAYAVLVKKHHPEEDEETFLKIHNAYKKALSIASERAEKETGEQTGTAERKVYLKENNTGANELFNVLGQSEAFGEEKATDLQNEIFNVVKETASPEESQENPESGIFDIVPETVNDEVLRQHEKPGKELFDVINETQSKGTNGELQEEPENNIFDILGTEDEIKSDGGEYGTNSGINFESLINSGVDMNSRARGNMIIQLEAIYRNPKSRNTKRVWNSFFSSPEFKKFQSDKDFTYGFMNYFSTHREFTSGIWNGVFIPVLRNWGAQWQEDAAIQNRIASLCEPMPNLYRRRPGVFALTFIFALVGIFGIIGLFREDEDDNKASYPVYTAAPDYYKGYGSDSMPSYTKPDYETPSFYEILIMMRVVSGDYNGLSDEIKAKITEEQFDELCVIYEEDSYESANERLREMLE